MDNAYAKSKSIKIIKPNTGPFGKFINRKNKIEETLRKVAKSKTPITKK